MLKKDSRRSFLKKAACVGLALAIPYVVSVPQRDLSSIVSQETTNPTRIVPQEFATLPDFAYENVSHPPIQWKSITDGIDFSRINVYKGDSLVDVIATVKIDPTKNDLTVYNGFQFDESKRLAANIEGWQGITKEMVMINGAQYQGGTDYYRSCALVMGTLVSLGGEKPDAHFENMAFSFDYSKKLGPLKNEAVRGMLVGQPSDSSLPNIDLLDFKYDSFDYNTTPYKHGTQHWMMLLDREGNVRVGETDWQANRAVVAKDWDNNILFMTTEGGYFTLKNFGRFLRDSNARPDGGLNIHTAMNMDGGYEASMIVKSPKIEYLTYGEFETQGPDKDLSVFGLKISIPGAIGVSPKK